MAAFLPEIAGDAKAFIAVVFDGLDLIESHRDVLSEALVHLRLAGGRAGGSGLGQEVLGNLLKLVDRV